MLRLAINSQSSRPVKLSVYGNSSGVGRTAPDFIHVTPLKSLRNEPIAHEPMVAIATCPLRQRGYIRISSGKCLFRNNLRIIKLFVEIGSIVYSRHPQPLPFDQLIILMAR